MDMFVQFRLRSCLVTVPAAEEYRTFIFFWPSIKPKKIELFSQKRQSPPENKSMLCLEWKPSHGYPVPTVFPAAKPDGFLLCTHSHFLPITRKLFSEKMDKNRGLELGNLKTNRKIRL